MKFTLENVLLRRTSQNNQFPWQSNLVTLVRVGRDGTVRQAQTDPEKRALVGAARDGDLLLAAWPGEWRQDVFVVDDLRAARLALGLPRNGTTDEAASTTTPDTDPRIGRKFTAEPRLWERLAQDAELPPVGQQQIAEQNPRAVEALLRRSDLDPGMRSRIVDGLPWYSTATAVEAGALRPSEVAQMLARYPDSASLLVAALRNPDTADIAKEHARGLSFDVAASVWVEERPGPELAPVLLPVVLTEQPHVSRTGYRADEYERSSLVPSMLEQLPQEERQRWIRHAEHGPLVRQTLLAGNSLADDELLACIPEITRSAPITAGQTPALIEYLRRYPQLVELAKPELTAAITQLVADGWSPAKAAQAGQWADLVAVAHLAETGDLIDKLLRAAVFDCFPQTTMGERAAPWRDEIRYELVDLLVAKTKATDEQITYTLDRLSTSHLTELQQAAGKRSRLRRLTAETLTSRQPKHSPTLPLRAEPATLPTDEELSAMDDPVSALLQLWRNRGPHHRREDVAAHILASRHTTEDVAWRLPIVDLEQHPVWGDRLADRIIELCGDSPARWQEFSRSWGQPTQLLADTLFSRLENIHD
ncbi:hypothetical protein [Amycolatopsis magusensis]|uniref:hypothetical protein n=1 Tax=Amycolatopsis magusensis TaxID=882444 RepID=UPI0024A92325|nr:hypothetical protein [Amycolatopsis magusensis]MDI5979294.1 hypothetical protein [Amycolatopsis magusensis]